MDTNKLTEGQFYCLLKLVEEAGEVQQAAMKLLAHGKSSTFETKTYDNMLDLVAELADLRAAIAVFSLLVYEKDGPTADIRAQQKTHHFMRMYAPLNK